MRSRPSLPILLLVVSFLVPLSCKKAEPPAAPQPNTATETAAAPAAAQAAAGEIALFEPVNAKGSIQQGPVLAAAAGFRLRVSPGTPAEAEAYYNAIRADLANFPQTTLQQSYIKDMLVYYGYPAFLAKDIERIDPEIMMIYTRLRTAVSNTAEFQAAYDRNPLQSGELVSVRFFAPKIINVRDPQVNGVPKGGFGWRKIVRFRSRSGSPARAAGFDTFYLLFNFTTEDPKFPPSGVHAAQLQAILTPIYRTGRQLRDIYFLVYESLADPTNPEKVGTFLKATFDLAGVVPEDKYYVPRACAQCHGTRDANQKGGKINYLDTDHWIDRTGDDFKKVNANDVIVDGAAAYESFRLLNTEIAAQNTAVVGSGDPFALLAAQKWLELHKSSGPDATRHVPPLRRGFVRNAGDPVWTDGVSPDTQLLPELNRYCFRCHSSINYHVFQKKSVMSRKGSIPSFVDDGFMPQDRELDATTKKSIIDHIKALP